MKLLLAGLLALVASPAVANETSCTKALMQDFMDAANASNQFKQQGVEVVDVSDISFVRDEDGRLVCHATLEMTHGSLNASIVVKTGESGIVIFQIVPD